MARYNTILFDADDTLLDFKKAESIALAETFAKRGIPFNSEINDAYQRINKEVWKGLETGELGKDAIEQMRFTKLFEEIGVTGVEGSEFNTEYLSLLALQGCLLDGAYELCQSLSENHRLYCVTNGIAEVQRSRLKTAGLWELFADVFISGEIGYFKPSREFFRLAFFRIRDFDIGSSIIIGDSLTSDMQGGISMGLDTCWYNPQGKENTLGLAVTYEIANLDQIPRIVC